MNLDRIIREGVGSIYSWEQPPVHNLDLDAYLQSLWHDDSPTPRTPAPRVRHWPTPRKHIPPPLAVPLAVPLAQYETSVRSRLESASYHHRFTSERLAALETLQAVNRRRTMKASGEPIVSPARLDRFHDCGSNITVLKSATEDVYALRGNFCRDRLCPACAHQRRQRLRPPIKAAIAAAMAAEPGYPPRIALLTLKRRNSPLADCIAAIRSAWRQLSQDPWFKKHCHGGCWALECKYKGGEAAWYLHMHLILMTPWLAESDLQARWLKYTGDSTYATCRQITDPHGEGNAHRAAGYITKYITKPAQLRDLHVNARADLAEASHGRRLWTCFGTIAAHKAAIIEADRRAEPPGTYVPLASLGEILLRALSGCTEAADILRALHLPRPGQDTLFSPAAPLRRSCVHQYATGPPN